MKYCILFVAGFLCLIAVAGQQCKDCPGMREIAMFDFDIRVPVPDNQDEKSKWEQLFYLSRHANDALRKAGANCTEFPMGMSQEMIDKGIMKIGATEAILPPGNVNAMYFTTGTVSHSGGNYKMSMELRAGCSGEIVATSGEIPFDFSSSSGYIASIAHQAATRLMPVYEKIIAFENNKKSTLPGTVLNGNNPEMINLVPATAQLVVGQETEVKIDVKDCDGSPVGNVTIQFGPSAKPGFEMEGTMGGIVTPSKVVTDAQGKASIKFKKTSGNSPSILNAHAYVNRASGCEDMLIGSVPIGSAWMQVDVYYYILEERGMGLHLSNEVYTMDVGSEKNYLGRKHTSTLYHQLTTESSDKISVNIWPKKMPGMKEQSKTIYVRDTGKYYFMKIAGPDETYSSHGAASKASRPEIHLNIDSGRLINFSIEFNYPNELKVPDEQEKIPPSFTVEAHTPGAVFTRTKIKDPSSPYKTKYRVDYYRKLDHKAKDVYRAYGYERCTLTIWSPY